jgi:hypothetical protein
MVASIVEADDADEAMAPEHDDHATEAVPHEAAHAHTKAVRLSANAPAITASPTPGPWEMSMLDL